MPYSDNPTFDDRDAELRNARQIARDKLTGPRIGDFVRMPDGELLRFTHDWGDEIQTTWRKAPGDASFHLFGNGRASFSGSLDSALPKAKLRETAETVDGRFWFFHHDQAGAHRGVYFSLPCRVFDYRPEA